MLVYFFLLCWHYARCYKQPIKLLIMLAFFGGAYSLSYCIPGKVLFSVVRYLIKDTARLTFHFTLQRISVLLFLKVCELLPVPHFLCKILSETFHNLLSSGSVKLMLSNTSTL